jgi:hypothetical protein
LAGICLSIEGRVFYGRFGEGDKKNVFGVDNMPWQGLICKQVVEGIWTLVCASDRDRKNDFGSREDKIVHTSIGSMVTREAWAAFGRL